MLRIVSALLVASALWSGCGESSPQSTAVKSSAQAPTVSPTKSTPEAPSKSMKGAPPTPTAVTNALKEVQAIRTAKDPIKGEAKSEVKATEARALATDLRDRMCACPDLKCLNTLREATEAVRKVTKTATPDEKKHIDAMKSEAKACLKKLFSDATDPNNPQSVVGLAQTLKKKICGCKDITCIQALSKEGQALEGAMKAGIATASRAEKSEVKRLEKEAMVCMSKLNRDLVKGSKPAKLTFEGTLVERFTTLKESICACKDMACLGAVQAGAATFIRAAQQERQPSVVGQKKIQALMLEAKACTKRLLRK